MRYRRSGRTFPRGIQAVWGVRRDGSTEVQSLRAKSDRWTREDFARWLREQGFKSRIEALGRRTRRNPLWSDDAIDLVRYVVVKGGATAGHARAFVAGSGATPLELDDAIEETAGRGLLAEHGQKLAPTPRGEAWLVAIRDGAHERATRLWLGEARANPGQKQGSFAWADDPKQLGLFDRPRVSEPEPTPPEPAPEPPAPKPRKERKPRTPRKPKHPYGAEIVLDSEGEITNEALHAWAARWSMHEGPEVPLHPDSGERYGTALDRIRLWAGAHYRHEDQEPEFWQKFLDIWNAERRGLTFEQLAKMQWCQIARYADARPIAEAAGAQPADLPFVTELRTSIVRQDKRKGEAFDAAADRTDLDWLALLNRWLDEPWTPPKSNPDARGAVASVRKKTEQRQRLEGYRADIRHERAEQKRARLDRKAELDQARGQTKRVRGKVTTASRGRRERIRARAWDRIERANRRIAELRSHAEWERGAVRKVRRGRLAEQNYEVEEEIKAIDPMLVPLWRRSTKLFRGSPHERAEQFLEYAEEQSEGDIWDAVEATLPTDAQLARDYEAWAREQAEQGAA